MTCVMRNSPTQSFVDRKLQAQLVSLRVTQLEKQTAEQRFGSQVKQAREERGWTQERVRRHVAELAGIELSQTAFTRLEQGKRPIRLNEAAVLAKLLDIDLEVYSDKLAQLTDEEYEQAKVWLEQVSTEEQEIAQQSSELQYRMERDNADLARRRRILLQKRVQYEAMINEYEARTRG